MVALAAHCQAKGSSVADPGKARACRQRDVHLGPQRLHLQPCCRVVQTADKKQKLAALAELGMHADLQCDTLPHLGLQSPPFPNSSAEAIHTNDAMMANGNLTSFLWTVAFKRQSQFL